MPFALQEVPDSTGEPDAVKVARPVRGRAVGKVPGGNSLAAYSTEPAALFEQTCSASMCRGGVSDGAPRTGRARVPETGR
jgi:cytochrome c5